MPKKLYTYNELAAKHGDKERFGIMNERGISVHGYWYQDWMLEFSGKFFIEVRGPLYQVAPQSVDRSFPIHM